MAPNKKNPAFVYMSKSGTSFFPDSEDMTKDQQMWKNIYIKEIPFSVPYSVPFSVPYSVPFRLPFPFPFRVLATPGRKWFKILLKLTLSRLIKISTTIKRLEWLSCVIFKCLVLELVKSSFFHIKLFLYDRKIFADV